MNTNTIKYLIDSVHVKIFNFSDEELSYKPEPGKWSKNEILGHLCDSAINNLTRFINSQFTVEPYILTGYSQYEWVRMNNYNNMSIEKVVTLFTILNERIIEVVNKIPEEKLNAVCIIGDAGFRENSGKESLQWIIEDYIFHMEYHIKQIL